MDFALNDEQRELKDYCRRFATEVIRPVAAKHDAEESTPWEVIKEAREWGLQGLEHMQRMADDPDGQFGVISAEEFHWGCAGIALAISGSGLAAAGLAASGTPEQIAEWVPQCFGIGDEIELGAYAVTEPQAGSDVKSLRTTAKLDGDEWVLNGTKVFITNGGIADVHVVVATVDPELGHRGQASFVIGKGTPGLRQGNKETKIGIRASHTAEVILEDCRIPRREPARRHGQAQRKLERARSGRSRGASNALATFEMTRPIVGASALGIAQAAYEWTLEYLDNGRPIDERLAGRSTRERSADPAGARRRRHRDRGGAAAGPARLVDGPQRHADDRRPGLDVEAQGRRRDDVGDADADGPGRPVRADHGLPAGEMVPRREDLPAVRGHGPGPAPGDLEDAGREYRERLEWAAGVAQDAVANGSAANGASGNGAAKPPAVATADQALNGGLQGPGVSLQL